MIELNFMIFMETIQISVPKKILEKVDYLIKKGLFSSRNDLLREALRNYINNSQFFGMVPYIIGPFSQKGLNDFKKDMENIDNLKISEKELKDLQNEFAGVKF